MTKSEIDIFGEKSVSYVKKIGNSYSIVRECDNKILVTSDLFEKYKGQIIRTMYTGECYGTGDYILEDENGKRIYTFAS